MIKLTRYKDPWNDSEEMKCYAEKYPYGEVTEPLIEKKEEGYFLTIEELRECFEASRQGTFKINNIVPVPFTLNRIMAEFTYKDFDHWLKSKEAPQDEKAE